MKKRHDCEPCVRGVFRRPSSFLGQPQTLGQAKKRKEKLDPWRIPTTREASRLSYQPTVASKNNLFLGPKKFSTDRPPAVATGPKLGLPLLLLLLLLLLLHHHHHSSQAGCELAGAGGKGTEGGGPHQGRHGGTHHRAGTSAT